MKLAHGFETPLVICGPLRSPRQMLGEQEYGGHASIHDDSMAEKLGFRAGPIEGPTHFSMFPPLLAQIWGREWFERGCISSHYQNMVIEGEEVRAFAEIPPAGVRRTRVWAQKAIVTGSKATITGCTPGAICVFRVAAVGSAGQGPWSDESLKMAP